MEECIEYNYSFVAVEDLEEDIGDVKAIVDIIAWPISTDEEQAVLGYTIAQVILSKHNDVILLWEDYVHKFNPVVLELVEKAKIEIQEYQ